MFGIMYSIAYNVLSSIVPDIVTNNQDIAGELYMAPAEFEDALDRNLPFGISKGCSRPLQAMDKLPSNRNA